MLSQDDAGIPFAIAQEKYTVRLLELPPSLLELLTQPSPPTLIIKSSGHSTPAQPSYAVLCTLSSTYALRQVNTSNSVFVTQSHTLRHDEDAEATVGLSAVSQCTDVLELHPATESPVFYLKKTLLPYTGPQDVDGDIDMSSAHTAGHGEGITKEEVFAGIPLSCGECELGWTSLVAFEHGKKSFVPSPRALMQLWKLALAGTVEDGTNLESQFLLQDLWQTIQHDGYPMELFQALLRRLSKDHGPGETRWVALSRESTVQWVGETALQVDGQDENGMPVSQLLSAWKDLLPEPWRDYAVLGSIKVGTELSGTKADLETNYQGRIHTYLTDQNPILVGISGEAGYPYTATDK